MSNLEVKLEKQDSRTEKKEALFRRMPSLRDLASECSSADVQDVILPSAIGRGKGSRGVYKKKILDETSPCLTNWLHLLDF